MGCQYPPDGPQNLFCGLFFVWRDAMFTNDYSAELLSRDKHRALQKEVESIRVLQSIRIGQRKRRNRRKLYSGLTTWLGTAFIVFGQKLKEL